MFVRRLLTCTCLGEAEPLESSDSDAGLTGRGLCKFDVGGMYEAPRWVIPTPDIQH